MIRITSHTEGVDGQPEFVAVDVLADDVHTGTLAMSPGQAAELVARIDAGETETDVTPITAVIAAQVLWHYNATGGMEPGAFIATLITALDRADRANTLRLAAVYPGYALAVHLAKNTEHGIRDLQEVAKQRLVTTGGAA